MRWPARHSPIGLDLGAHAFKAVQMRGDRVAASLLLPRTNPGGPLAADELLRLAGVLDRRGFVGPDVVVAVPAAGLLSSILELPARVPGLPLEQIAAAEFGRVHKLDAAAVCMSAWDLPAAARATRATYMLAVGAATATLDAHIDLVESAGLNVVAVDEPSTAAVRGALHGTATDPATDTANGGGQDDGLAVVIDLGRDAATLAVVKGDAIVYTRKLADAGMARVVRAAAEAADCAPEDVEASPDADFADLLSAHFAAVLKEIARAVDYTAHQYPDAPVRRAVLVGGGAAAAGAVEQFHAALGVPVMPPAAVPPASASALGLSLWTEAGR